MSRSDGTRLVDRIAMGMYGAAHAARAIDAANLEEVVAMLFHYIVIILALSFIGLEDSDWLGLRLARAFLFVECLTDVALLSTVAEGVAWTTLTLPCAAILGLCAHRAADRANLSYRSSLLCIESTDASCGPA